MKRHELFLRLVYVSTFMIMAGVVSFMPLWLASKGYTKTEIGFILSLGPLISIGSNLLWGYLSDRYQTIRKLLWIILLGQLIALLALTGLDAFAAVASGMVLFFFFQTPMVVLADSLTIGTIGERRERYASFRVWGSVSFAAAAVLLGSFLRDAEPDSILYALIAAVCLSFTMTLGLQDRIGTVSKMDLSGIVKVFGSKSFLAFLAMVFVMSYAHRTNDNFLALYLQALGGDKTIVGWAWMASALSEIPTFYLLSRYGHRFKELPLLSFAGLIYGIRFTLYGYAETPNMVAGLQLLHSLSFGIFLVTAIRYISAAVPDEYRGTGQAVFAITWAGLAGLTSGAIGGYLFDLYGGGASYTLAGGMGFVACIGFLVLHWASERRSARGLG